MRDQVFIYNEIIVPTKNDKLLSLYNGAIVWLKLHNIEVFDQGSIPISRFIKFTNEADAVAFVLQFGQLLVLP